MLGSVDEPMNVNPKRQKTDAQWEADHISAFGEAQLEWPPNFSTDFEQKTSHLSRRVAEVVWYWEHISSKDSVPTIGQLSLYTWSSPDASRMKR